MKNSKQTLLEIINHISSSHPELHQVIEQWVYKKRKVSPDDIDFLLTMNAQNLSRSKSQLRQDLFVLSQLDFKRNGFFVEFGATNGIDLSNSYLLEKDYGWSGILAEPAKCWHADLQRNRNCFIELNCVWSESNSKLVFNEARSAELGTIHEFSSNDFHSKARENGQLYEVSTISLGDLLEKYGAPAEIDYLSIDTEGSEFEILRDFDFSRHTFHVITCEHNFTPVREKIYDLLVSNGYKRVFERLSKFDDWYIRAAPQPILP